jgi:hypothetical protein
MSKTFANSGVKLNIPPQKQMHTISEEVEKDEVEAAYWTCSM